MSIRDELTSRASEGQLVRVAPCLEGAPELRVVYMTAAVHDEVFGAEASDAARMAQLHADLDRFIAGERIVVGNRFSKTAFMKRLEPGRDEVWEIRSIDPKPSIRLFGRFAMPDVFIVTGLAHRTLLGAFQSFEWQRERRDCLAKWRGLFGTWPPHSGSTLNDYISENAVDLGFDGA